MKYTKNMVDRLLAGFEYSERKVEVPFVLENLPEPNSNINILDIGSCESELCNVLYDVGFSVMATDMRSPDKNFKNFTKCDARHLPFENNVFDVVTNISAIEHMGLVPTPYHTDVEYDSEADVKVMAEMMRVLKPNGQMILTIPYGIGSDGLRSWVKFYNKELLSKLLNNPELEIDKVRFTLCIDNDNFIWKEITQEEAEGVASLPNKVICNLCILGHKRN